MSGLSARRSRAARRSRLGTLAPGTVAIALLSGCTLLTDSTVEPSRIAAQPAESQSSFPNLGSVPDEPPVVTPRAERQRLLEQLSSDRDAAGVAPPAATSGAPQGGSN